VLNCGSAEWSAEFAPTRTYAVYTLIKEEEEEEEERGFLSLLRSNSLKSILAELKLG
jgi:hypothetical protein